MRETWDRASWSLYCLPVCVDVHRHGSAACKNSLALSARLKHRRPDSGVITIHHQYGSVKRTMDARSAATNERKLFLRWTELDCGTRASAKLQHASTVTPSWDDTLELLDELGLAERLCELWQNR